jgi:HK97 family phage portal protein
VEQVVHYKYVPDPFYPMRGMGALRPVAREVDSDNELTRYLKSLLQNDAVPRGVLSVPPGVAITKNDKEEAKQNFKRLFGGDNRGDVAVFDKGLTYTRMSLDMGELAFDALRGVPEARIASAFGVPPIVAGLNVGLTRSTYSNYEEARKAFTEQTLVPLWKAVASEIQQSLVPFYGGNIIVDFDLTKVAALKEDLNARAVWVISAWDKGLLTRNQSLKHLGEQSIEGPEGDEYRTPPPAPMLPAPAPVDASADTTMDAQWMT